MKDYCIQIQFGHTGDNNKTRTLTLFITKRDTVNIPEFFDIIFKNNPDIEIKTRPNYTRHLTIIINWNDYEYYSKYFIYKYNWKHSMISLRSEHDLDKNEVIEFANNIIFLNDNNREEKEKELCEILITKKDKVYKFQHDSMERYTNLEYCIKYGNKEFLKKYNHIIQARNFDLL
jgi:hypothetical protein